MKRFEYRLEELPIDIKAVLHPNQIELQHQLKEKLNELGKDGWRLCGVNDRLYYFAREV